MWTPWPRGGKFAESSGLAAPPRERSGARRRNSIRLWYTLLGYALVIWTPSCGCVTDHLVPFYRGVRSSSSTSNAYREGSGTWLRAAPYGRGFCDATCDGVWNEPVSNRRVKVPINPRPGGAEPRRAQPRESGVLVEASRPGTTTIRPTSSARSCCGL